VAVSVYFIKTTRQYKIQDMMNNNNRDYWLSSCKKSLLPRHLRPPWWDSHWDFVTPRRGFLKYVTMSHTYWQNSTVCRLRYVPSIYTCTYPIICTYASNEPILILSTLPPPLPLCNVKSQNSSELRSLRNLLGGAVPNPLSRWGAKMNKCIF
jgi:hypothetical protein